MIPRILHDSYDTIWFLGYYTIPRILYDIIWYYMILYDIIWFIWYYMIPRILYDS